MSRKIHFAILMALAMTCEAQGMGSLAEVAVIDRDSGAVLSPHFYRGEYWVAGSPGGRYAIEIRNRIGERLLAVTSVDGVNVVSGATAGWDQTGYVFSPGESYQITGWRKTDAEVAAFTFTASPNSYAERTGRPANVGVIGVAIFRERQLQPVYVPPIMEQSLDRADAPPLDVPAPAPAPSPTSSPPSGSSPSSAPASAPLSGSTREARSSGRVEASNLWEGRCQPRYHRGHAHFTLRPSLEQSRAA